MKTVLRSTGGGRSSPPAPLVRLLASAGRLAIVFLAASVGYTLFMALETSVEKTRISENALLAGLVEDTFNDPQLIAYYTKRLMESADNRRALGKCVEEELRKMRIEAYRQRFASRPSSFMKSNVSSSLRGGENVYGIVRAVRTAPLESILIVARIDKAHIASMALVLTLANYAKKQIYWARDVTFLFIDGNRLAMESWMAVFYGYDHQFVEADELIARGGPIIGAVVYDLIGSGGGLPIYDFLNIQYGMINGRRPNLDLVNLFILLAEKYGATPAIYNTVHSAYNSYDYESALLIFARAVFSQSFIETEGLHSVIGGYGVNAITVQARYYSNHHGQQQLANGDDNQLYRPQMTANAGGSLKAVDMVKVAEGGLRSLNNILEKFHQSYFLYLLVHTHKFVSVAYYMPVVGLLLAPLVVFALYDWLRFMYGPNVMIAAVVESSAKENNSVVAQEFQDPSPQSGTIHDGEDDIGASAKTASSSSSALLPSAFSITITHLLSLAFYASLIFLYSRPPPFAVSEDGEWMKWLTTSPSNLSALALLLPCVVVTPIAMLIGEIKNDSHYFLVRFLIAFETALFIGALSLMNFALAVSLGVLLLPLALLVLMTDRNTNFLVKFVGFTLCNPLTVALSVCVALEHFSVASMGGLSHMDYANPTVLRRLFNRLLNWVSRTVYNHFAHESALFPILTIMSLSIFNVLVQVLVYNHFERTRNEEKSTDGDAGKTKKEK